MHQRTKSSWWFNDFPGPFSKDTKESGIMPNVAVNVSSVPTQDHQRQVNLAPVCHSAVTCSYLSYSVALSTFLWLRTLSLSFSGYFCFLRIMYVRYSSIVLLLVNELLVQSQRLVIIGCVLLANDVTSCGSILQLSECHRVANIKVLAIMSYSTHPLFSPWTSEPSTRLRCMLFPD